jgi:hypothetical protein
VFYFRINKLQIFDNKTGKGFLGLAGDKTTVQLWSLVITGNIELPNLDQFMNTKNEKERRDLAAQIVATVAASRRLTPIESVKDNKTILFGDTGYVMFQAKEIPEDFNWEFTAIKVNDKTRDIGAEMVNVINDKEFSSFANNLPTIARGAVTPAYTAAVEVGKFIFSVIGNNLAKKKDQQLGLMYMSLDKREHYPHGVRNSTDVSDLTGNMLVDYAIFAYDEKNIHEDKPKAAATHL